jgi:3-methyl-2-oxobutanoate hydroxymethyltransferase
MKNFPEILGLKNKRKIIALTAYDFPTAALLDQAGIDIILVGDSLANVVLGLQSTRDVGMVEMLHHCKAVTRAVKNALVVADMPYESYQLAGQDPVQNARRFIEEAGCAAVKLEWFPGCLKVSERIINMGIAVMGHIGLTPQTADKTGGFKVQGREAQKARSLIQQAKSLEKIGCFSLILECIPEEISGIITKEVKIPTIGIGAGKDCDGQILVLHDLIGLYPNFRPKFVKKYVDVSKLILEGIAQYKKEVLESKFPDQEHSFSIKPQELQKLKNLQ